MEEQSPEDLPFAKDLDEGGSVEDRVNAYRSSVTQSTMELIKDNGLKFTALTSKGDFQLKSNGLPATEQMVTCNPDLRTADITDDTEFLLIASDGIWDILSSQGAVDFVHRKLASGTTDLRTICEGLLSHCFRSRDNSTVILVQFKPAARIPLAPPASAAPVVNPSATETSSAANPDASAEAKADSDNEIEEIEGALLPLSTLPSSSQL
ncbi:hypothetical protein ACQ4PT_012405 [Festuca glaucescens]